MSKNLLTPRQQKVLEYITWYIQENGFPPTLREIGVKFEITSTNGVKRHVDALLKKGVLTRGVNTSRTLSLTKPVSSTESKSAQQVPIVGRVAAGIPITAYENLEGSLLVDSAYLKSKDKHFALQVKGDSMIDDGIFEADYVIICPAAAARHNEIVVARLHDEATVKRFYNKNGLVQLLPANKKYKPIAINNFDEFSIIGIVVGVMRWIR